MKFKCTICGHVYDESVEGKDFDNLPNSWTCPVCGVSKDMFERD